MYERELGNTKAVFYLFFFIYSHINSLKQEWVSDSI